MIKILISHHNNLKHYFEAFGEARRIQRPSKNSPKNKNENYLLKWRKLNF